MNNFVVTASSTVTEADVQTAKLGGRFGRMDLFSQCALLAVEKLNFNDNSIPKNRVAICLSTKTGSISTDAEYWKRRNAPGGPSPTLFAYTLPSAAIGEIAIRHRLTGPNLCFLGDDEIMLSEARELLRRGEADACICVSCNVVTKEASEILQIPPVAEASALYLKGTGDGLHVLREIDRDMALLCALICARKSAS